MATPSPSLTPAPQWLWSRSLDLAALIAIVVLGLALRLSGVLHGTGFHPDERHMVMVTNDLVNHAMNPRSFAYGSFSFYAAWLLTRALNPVWGILTTPFEWFVGPLPDNAIGYEGTFLVGRLFCVLMGTLAIALTYYLGRLVYGRSGVGLAAAALLSCNVFHIQLSRFFTSDIPLTTLCLAAIISLVHLYRSGSLAWFIAFGFFAGLATATKISSVFLSVPLALALVLLELRQSDGTKSWKPYLVRAGSTLAVFVAFLAVWQVGLANGMTVFGSQVPKVALLIPLAAPMFVCVAALWWNYSKPIAYTALAFAVGVVIFMTAEPYAILDYNTFTQHTREQTSMVRGYWRPPYTIQYERTVPYFYHLKQMLWYTMGWPVFLGVAIGFMAALARSGASIVTLVFRSPFERRLREEIIPVTFVIVFFATTAGFQVKFPRYLMPLYPFLFVFTAALFSSVLEGIPAFERSKFSARGTERA